MTDFDVLVIGAGALGSPYFNFIAKYTDLEVYCWKIIMVLDWGILSVIQTVKLCILATKQQTIVKKRLRSLKWHLE